MRKALVLTLLALAVGCQAFSTARAREKAIIETYTDAVVLVTQARRQGKIDDETWMQVKLSIRVARGARIAVKKAREEGRTDTVAVLLQAMLGAMAEVIAYKESLL